MNGFATALFWQLWAVGLLGVALKILLSWADKTDTRTVTFHTWLQPSRVALSIVAHTVLCTILWEWKMDLPEIPGFAMPTSETSGNLNAITAIFSGMLAKSVIGNLVGIVSSRFGDGKDDK